MSVKRVVYPAARRAATTYTLHGKTIPEPYDYLEDPSADETRKFVAAQNATFQDYMKSSSELRDRVFKRMETMRNYPRTGAPSLRNGRYYFNHNTGLQNQDVVRRSDTLEGISGDAEVFLDVNTFSADGTSALGPRGWSESEEVYAYGVFEKGSDWEHIRVRRADGTDLEDRLDWVKFSNISFWKDYGFFYTRFPALGDDADKGAETDTAENACLSFHRLGTPQSEDVDVLRVPEHPTWMLSGVVSDCHRYLTVTVSVGCEPHNLFWVAELPAGGPGELKAPEPLKFNKVINEFVGEYNFMGNDAEIFYFLSSRDAPRKKVVSVDIRDGTETELVPQQQSVLSDANLCRSTLVLTYLEDVKDVVYYRQLHEAELKRLELPIGTIVGMFVDRHKDFVSLKLSSFLLPGRTYALDISDPQGTLRVLGDDHLPGLNADDFVTEQKFYHSDDGTRIPMFIVHRRGEVTPETPVLQYGYGGFSISIQPYFSSAQMAFIQGFNGVLAIPNIRGGGEYGQEWHDAGRRANKQNCFTDFIAATRFLHSQGIGSPATTAIMGGSNGGLLVAATVNQAPELYRCVICQVGVLDVYKFHKFTIGHAWISDYGNPDVAEDFAVVEKYSPLHNIRAGVAYPPILVVTSDHDDRVVPLHSLKYIATLQHENPDHGGPFLARVEVAAGHGAGKPISKQLAESADIYAFIGVSLGAKWSD